MENVRRMLMMIGAMNLMVLNNLKGQVTMEWVKAFNGINQEVGKSISYDASGNCYITGYFTGVTDFDPGSNSLLINTQGYQDIFVSKLDIHGNLLWVKSVGGVGNDIANDIAVDEDGGVYITGFFRNTVDFNPGPGITNISSATASSQDIFVLKLDSLGNYIWAKSFGGSGYYDSLNNLYDAVSNAYSLTIDQFKYVYITGSFLGNIDFDPNIGIYNMASSSVSNIFVSKLNCGGDFVWAKRIGENKHGDEAYSITSDQVSNIYISGVFADTCDFDPGSNNYDLISSSATSAFALKLDFSGNFIWAQKIGGMMSNDQAGGYAIHWSSSLGILITGHFKGNIHYVSSSGLINITSNGAHDVLMIKLSDSGTINWVKSFGGSNNEYSYTITSDNYGNIYLSGSFKGTVDFDPGYNTAFLSTISTNHADIYLLKLDGSGNFLWARKMGGSGNDLGNSLTIDLTGNILMTGYYSGSAGFDPISNVINLNSSGGIDAFVLKYNQNTMILPLTLKHFIGIPVNAGNLLKWETLNEIKTDYFEVEQSNDAIEFTKIGLVECLSTEGNRTAYRYLDAFHYSGKNYYRLKQIESDGQFSYSNIISIVQPQNNADIILSPNPTSGKLKIETPFDLEKGMIRITDMEGQVLMINKNVNGHLFNFDLSCLKDGDYLIQIDDRSSNTNLVMNCSNIKIQLQK